VTEVLGQDKDFAIVVVQRGDDLASLAKRYLGDADKSWWISEFNGIDKVQPARKSSSRCARETSTVSTPAASRRCRSSATPLRSEPAAR